MSDYTLQVADLTKTYNAGKPSEVRVLQGVSLDVAPGEVVALVAPSGAGKSTLLHIAGLLDTPDSGSVQIEGTDMTRLSDRKRTAVRRSTVGFIYAGVGVALLTGSLFLWNAFRTGAWRHPSPA